MKHAYPYLIFIKAGKNFGWKEIDISNSSIKDKSVELHKLIETEYSYGVIIGPTYKKCGSLRDLHHTCHTFRMP